MRSPPRRRGDLAYRVHCPAPRAVAFVVIVVLLFDYWLHRFVIVKDVSVKSCNKSVGLAGGLEPTNIRLGSGARSIGQRPDEIEMILVRHCRLRDTSW